MATLNGKEGVWRTVGGRRIFIADGEDLKTAMKNSGKFKSANKGGSLKDIVGDTQPEDTKYLKFSYKATKDEISLRVRGKNSIYNLDGNDDGIDPDELAISKMEVWANKIANKVKKNKSIENNEEIAEYIKDELDYDWYSGMTVIDDVIFFDIPLDEF